jgi:hypothetical protein
MRHTGTVTRPRFESAPYRQHPSRTRHIYGELQPMDADEQTPAWVVIIMVGFFAVVAWLCASKGWGW